MEENSVEVSLRPEWPGQPMNQYRAIRVIPFGISPEPPHSHELLREGDRGEEIVEIEYFVQPEGVDDFRPHSQKESSWWFLIATKEEDPSRPIETYPLVKSLRVRL